MQFVRWADLEAEVRERILTAAGIWHSQPNRAWDEFIPETKVRLADALATMSGNTTSLENDEDMLTVRRWNSMTESERRAEYDAIED